MRKQVRLYNMFFPLWMLLFFPVTWLLVIPANFMFDSLVLFIAVSVLRLHKKKELYVKSIFRVWIFGFLADLISAVFMLGVYGVASFKEVNDHFLETFLTNPWQHPIALLATAAAIFLAGWVIYLLNRHWTFKKQPLTDISKRRISLILAVLTAPYFFLIPLNWLI